MKKLILLTLILIGCATSENYEKVLGSWIGAPESALISNWGPPSSTYQISANSKVLTYLRGRTVQLGGFATTTPITTNTNGAIYGNVNGTYTSTSTTNVPTITPVTNIALNCNTRFTVNNGFVTNWAWEGNDCKAKAPPTQVQTPNPNNAEIQKKIDNRNELLKTTCKEAELQEYYKKSACSAFDIAFEQITDSTKITDEQKNVLIKQRQKVMQIEKISDEIETMRGVVGQKFLDIVANYTRPENEKNNLDLYNGVITWGEYNKKRKEIALETKNRITR